MYGRNKSFFQMLFYSLTNNNVKIHNIDTGWKTSEILTVGTYLGFWNTIVVCECGANSTKQNIKRHQTTKQHFLSLESKNH